MKKITMIGMILSAVLLSVPFDVFAAGLGAYPTSIARANLENATVTTNQPRRGRRTRRVWRNGRWVWVPAYRNYGQYRRTQVGNRRYRLVRRYYYIGGVRRYRLVRVYY